MDSAMIGKIMKAKQYAQERDRMQFESFQVRFRGNHDSYLVSYHDGVWNCTCHFFSQRGVCSHTMALERVLENMVQPAMVSEMPVV